MKKLTFALALFSAAVLHAGGKEEFSMSAGFVENKGQVADQSGNPRPDVLFLGSSGNIQLQLRRTGFSYELQQATEIRQTAVLSEEHAPPPVPSYSISINRIDVELAGCNPNAQIITGEKSPDVLHFFTNGERVTNVHHYATVTYKNIYPAIDLVFYNTAGRSDVKYDFIIRPGGDPSMIRMRYNGADHVALEGGSLKVFAGKEVITEDIPLAFQTRGAGEQEKILCSFGLSGNEVYFLPVTYDRTLPLVIDPTVSRLWGTYYGRQGDDSFEDVKTDASGNIFLCGRAGYNSTTLATSGAYQQTIAGAFDGLLTVFDSTGARVWSTYFGGAQDDYFMALDFDTAGQLVLVGYTESTTGLATAGAYQSTYGGGGSDGFVARFTALGFPVWFTYYGGSLDDHLVAIEADASGNIYFGGYSNSISGISTPGSFQTTYGGGSYDGLLAKMDTTGNLFWCTYFGGTLSDYVEGIDVYADSTIYIVGPTSSTAGIATPGSYQSAMAGGVQDGYLAKFHSSGQLHWSTYYGGSAGDYFNEVCHDSNGRILITGGTSGSTGIASPGAFKTAPSGTDAIIVVFDSTGNRGWATYYGGLDIDGGRDITIDQQDNLVVAGRTMSPTDVASPGAWQTVHASYTQIGGAKLEHFVVKFNPTGGRIWGTYYGGNDEDAGYDVTVDPYGRIIISGSSKSTNNISSPGSFQPTFYSGSDGFVARFDELIIQVDSIPSPFCAGTQVNVTFNAIGYFGPTNTFNAELSDATGSFASPVVIGSISGQTSGTIVTTIPVNTPGGSGYRIRVKSVDRGVSDGDNGSNLTIHPIPVVTMNIFPFICVNSPVFNMSTVSPGGQPAGGTYSGPGVDASGNFDASVAGVGTHTMTYTYTDVNNCTTQVVSQSFDVHAMPNATFGPIPNTCDSTAPFTLTQGQPPGGIYFGFGVTSTGQFDPSLVGPGTHTIYYAAINGACVDTAQQTIVVLPPPVPPVITFASGLFTSTVAVTYQWYCNGNMLFGQTSQTCPATIIGQYYVIVIDSNGCTAQSNSILYNDVQQVFSSGATVSAFPNPFSDELNILYTLPQAANVAIRLLDISGKEIRVILPDHVMSPGTYDLTDNFQPEELAAGVYIIEFRIDEETRRIRVIHD